MALLLDALYVYPIKSCAGFAPAEWRLDALGLEHDRRWMLVNDEGVAVTQRDAPTMALVRPRIDRDRLRVNTPGHSELSLPLVPREGEQVPVRLWDWSGDGLAASPEGTEWFSRVLGRRVRPVYCAPGNEQQVNPTYAPGGFRTGFSDGYPLLLTALASLAELNRRVPEPLSMNRFRPNLVVSGTSAFEEDQWKHFRVGEVQMTVVKGCDRCVLTTTDQETAARGPEPLRTLASFRKWDGKVWFGQNVVHAGAGTVRVGDSVVIAAA